MRPKKEFLLVYDYGMGGLWAVAFAHSIEEVAARYPDLKILDRRPEWMDDAQYSRIKDDYGFDIEASGPDWLILFENGCR